METGELYARCEELKTEYRKWRKINAWIDRVLLSVLLFLIVFIGSGLIDNLVFLEEGINSVEYHGFADLLKTNPDTVAWIKMDETHIDHPVVKGEDNFEYLDKGFDGSFYAGGSIFLDGDNSGTGDPYVIIHGHHMAAGAMFGDLDKFTDREFFDESTGGTLLTPEYDYDIKLVAQGTFNAYDRSIYRFGTEIPLKYIKANAEFIKQDADLDSIDHMLVLSTCKDDMTDNRTVVFCSL